MNDFFFTLGQYLLPVINFWPIWVVIGGAFFIASKMKNALFQRGLKIFAVVTIVIVFGIRGLFFLVQPYQSQQFTSNELSLPARFYFNFGEGNLSCSKATNEWKVNSFSPKNYYKFQQELYEYDETGTHHKLNVLHFTEKTPMNVISKRWHIENVEIPAQYAKNVIVQYNDAAGTISLENCQISDLRLDTSESNVTIIIPGGQKKYKLKLLGVKAKITLRLPRNSEINATEVLNTFMTSPAGFTRINQYQWKKTGNGGPIIDLEVGAGRDGLALEYTD